MWSREPIPEGRQRNGATAPTCLWKPPKGSEGGAETLVQIEHTDAIELIGRFNSPDVFMYLDPPYLRSTRRSGALYTHEMTEADQRRLLEAITRSKAYIMLSGYDSSLYNEALAGWHKDSIMVTTTSTAAAMEVIWMNYAPPFEQYSIFEMTEEET